ncbi:MFS transporter [Knoellia sp. CPCC 206453]|uniref:MFS transporter n=1 Tax=Knoellia pratensis TaxID=3404796 RepID=UPI003621081F
MSADVVPGRATWREWAGLALMIGPILMVSMDGSILFLAMPRITEALGPSASQQLWILDIYGFLVAGLLITMGAIGDRRGRIALMWIGALVFGLASVIGAISTSPEMLIAARALMGIGGSTLLPASLAIIGTLFTDPRQRSTAIGLWAAMFGAGFAAGPLAGALLLDHFWWGSVFLVNVPIVLAFLALAPFLLREPAPTAGAAIDPISVATSFVGILLAVHALKGVATHGLQPSAILTGIVGVTLLVVFVRRQRVLSTPLVNFALFRDPHFSLAILAAAMSVASYAVASYLGGVYLQTVLGLGIVAAGLLAVPVAVTTFAFSTGTGALVARLSPRTVLASAYGAMGLGLLVLLLTRADGNEIPFVVGTAISGIGYGLVFAVASETAVTAAPPEEAGSAAAISETSFELGQALGLALLGSLAALVFRSLGPGVAPTLDGTLLLVGSTGERATSAVSAYMTGFHGAAIVGGVVNLVLAVITLRWLPRAHSSSRMSERILPVSEDAPGR